MRYFIQSWPEDEARAEYSVRRGHWVECGKGTTFKNRRDALAVRQAVEKANPIGYMIPTIVGIRGVHDAYQSE